MKHQKAAIVFLVLFSCLIMGLVDAVIRPGYFIKSAVKIPLFLLLTAVYGYFDRGCDLRHLFTRRKGSLKAALLTGGGIYAVVLLAFLLLRNFFDFSAVTASLSQDVGVTAGNFLFVALYISFVNSFLEEFFFRGFAFLTLRQVASRRFAYFFSSLAFALYHIAMMIGWFDWPVVALAVAGLTVGGLLFNRFDEKSGSLYPSWIIHMFANFATNTVGFLLFAQAS
ncbi:MAG: CPBP family intramembrane metalloprotease [Clostridiales bacterium]|nr:CPBP family intramembrane metalloprotease [Clostridiales bacterium]